MAMACPILLRIVAVDIRTTYSVHVHELLLDVSHPADFKVLHTAAVKVVFHVVNAAHDFPKHGEQGFGTHVQKRI
jgi:hypothetical protein